MTHEKCFLKHGIFILSYLLLVGIEAYFIRSIHVLYSPYLLLGILVALGLGLNFVFLFVFGKKEQGFAPFVLCQGIQAVLIFLITFFLFNLSWENSLVYPAGAILGVLAFWLLRSELALRNVLLTILLAAGFTIALRLSAVSGGLLFALVLLNSFYLGSKLLASHPSEQSLWESVVIFTVSLALGRAAIQYYLIQSAYDSLGVVITHPYTFVALFAGFLLPIVYGQVIKDKGMGAWMALLVLGIFFPWTFGIFIHVRPFAGYLLGFALSSFMMGILFSGPLSLSLLSYLNYASGVLGLTVFSLLSNLSRGIRLGMLAAVFVLAVLVYVIQSLIQKNKS